MQMKNIIIIVLLCLSASAMAQSVSGISENYNVCFPKLPPLIVENRITLTSLHNSWLLIQPDSNNVNENHIPQSVMVHSAANSNMPNFQIKATVDTKKHFGDPLIGIRDQIYRKRMEKQDRPVQPRMTRSGRIIK